LDWDDSTHPNFSHYRVYKQESNGVWPTTPNYTTTVSQQTVTGLTNGVSYTFRVTQVTLGAAESDPIIVTAQPQAPVTGVSGTVITNGQLRQSSTTRKLLLPKDGHVFQSMDSVIAHGDTATMSSTDFVGIAIKVPSDRSRMLLGYVANDRLYLTKREGTTHTVINSRPLSALMIPGRPYWLRVLASQNVISVSHWLTDPQLGGLQQDALLVTLSGADATNYGANASGRVGIYLDTPTGWATRWVDDFRVASIAGPGTDAVANNQGNFRAEPLITLTGPMSAPEILNMRNGQIMRMTGNILQGEVIYINVATRSITDQSGATRMSQLDLASDWIELEPGENQLRVSTPTPGLTTAMTIAWRDSFL
jgi:hypothetical protein